MKIIPTQDFVDGRIHFVKQDGNQSVYEVPDAHAKRFIDAGNAKQANDKEQANVIVVRDSDLTIPETPQADVMTEPQNQVERFREPEPVNPVLDDDVTTKTIDTETGKQTVTSTNTTGNNKRS